MDNSIRPPEQRLYNKLPRRPKVALTVWNAVWPPALYSVIQIVVSLVGSILLSISSALSNDGINPDEIDALLTDAINQWSMPFMAISMIMALSVFIPFYIRFRRDQEKRTSLTELGFGNASLILLLAISSYISISMILLFLPQDFGNYAEHMQGLTSGSFVWQLLVVGFGAPIIEELCLRGLTLNRLLKIMSPVPAILIQASIFGIMHFNIVQSSYAFLLGLPLGWLCCRTRSLWPSFLLHLFINAGSVLLGEFVGTGGDVAAEPVEDLYASVIIILLFSLACVAALIYGLNKTLPGRKTVEIESPAQY